MTIKNNTPDKLGTESIQKEINILEMDYLDPYIEIMEVSAKATENDVIIYELLIKDNSSEPIPKTHKQYLEEIADFTGYAIDMDLQKIETNIEIISKEDKLSRVTLTLTF